MKDYFKRLKDHPGVPVATLMTVLCTLAGMTNESCSVLEGAIIGLAMSAFIWLIVLISNIKRKKHGS